MKSRRKVLTSVGIASSVVLAGCIGGDDEGGDNDDGDDTEDEEAQDEEQEPLPSFLGELPPPSEDDRFLEIIEVNDLGGETEVAYENLQNTEIWVEGVGGVVCGEEFFLGGYERDVPGRGVENVIYPHPPNELERVYISTETLAGLNNQACFDHDGAPIAEYDDSHCEEDADTQDLYIAQESQSVGGGYRLFLDCPVTSPDEDELDDEIIVDFVIGNNLDQAVTTDLEVIYEDPLRGEMFSTEVENVEIESGEIRAGIPLTTYREAYDEFDADTDNILGMCAGMISYTLKLRADGELLAERTFESDLP